MAKHLGKKHYDFYHGYEVYLGHDRETADIVGIVCGYVAKSDNIVIANTRGKGQLIINSKVRIQTHHNNKLGYTLVDPDAIEWD